MEEKIVEAKEPSLAELKNEPQEETKMRRKYTKRKKSAVKISPELVEMLAPAVCEPFDWIFTRVDAEKLSKEERKRFTSAVAALVNKYAPSVVTKYGEELNLALCLFGILSVRAKPLIESYRKKKEEKYFEKQNYMMKETFPDARVAPKSDNTKPKTEKEASPELSETFPGLKNERK